MPGIFQPRANEYMKGKDSTTGRPEPVTVTNGAFSVASAPNLVGTAAECQTQADLLDTTDVGVYTFFATDTNQYGMLSAYAGGTGTITWETVFGATYVLPNASAQVLQGNVYSTLYDNLAAGGASTFAKYQILNPAASGVYVAITRITMQGITGVTTDYEYGFYGTALSTANSTHGQQNRLSSGSAGSAVAYYEVTATNLMNTQKPLGRLSRHVNDVSEANIDFVFQYPPIVDENNGFILHDITANVASRPIVIEWVEIAK